ncbi:MAG: histidine--tRNA ligase [Myxococcales bacterium]|nr:histidine--tRNA ligase [Myxococcales bacterium]
MSERRLQPPRGTRDFYPEDLRLRTWLFGHFRAVAAQFGYEEVDAPVVEHEDLFIRKAGEEIVDQLYSFELHDRRLALRPEFTPSLARMVMARQGGLPLPVRWFSIPQCWRYERMTRGRRREHYQWNMDLWGVPGVEAEAELIAAVFALLDRLGLASGDVRMRLNSRALVEEIVRSRLDLEPGRFEPLCIVIDKLDKIGGDAVVELLSDASGDVRLEPGAAREVVDLLSVRDLDEAARRAPAGSETLEQLRRLFELLDAYGVADRVVFDASVVRGLAYYTGVVFEAQDAAGELRAICGGGRYDRLLEKLGGTAIPAVGFGFGDAVITELLADRSCLPELPRALDDIVFGLGSDPTLERAAITRAAALRAEGRSVELRLGDERLKRALRSADRSGAQRVHWIGPEELARGCARVKNLRTGEERDEPLSE